MRVSRRLFQLGIIASIFGRASAAAREVKLVGEDGWVDLDLPLTEFKGRSNVYRLIARGLLDRTSVGIGVEIDGHWSPKPTEHEAVTLYWGFVTLRSIGLESDALAMALSRLYGIPHAGLRMLPEIRAEAVGLASDPRLIESEPVKMKLFFHSESDERRSSNSTKRIQSIARTWSELLRSSHDNLGSKYRHGRQAPFRAAAPPARHSPGRSVKRTARHHCPDRAVAASKQFRAIRVKTSACCHRSDSSLPLISRA
jgi:hypothetical protein